MTIFAREQVLPKCDDNRFAVRASGRPTPLNILGSVPKDWKQAVWVHFFAIAI
jgi:hypothetical protein